METISASASESSSEVRGLSEFFGELSTFVCSVRTQYGLASMEYSLLLSKGSNYVDRMWLEC